MMKDLRAQSAEALDLNDLAERFEVVPLSEARANLSQLVERVAYSGVPVLISKHDRVRAAVVPPDLLARDQARFRAAAERVLARRGGARAASVEEVDFEDIEGLSESALAAARERLDVLARREDVISDATVAEIVNSPLFARGVEKVVTQMALGRPVEQEASSG